jgi:hypothetical protein
MIDGEVKGSELPLLGVVTPQTRLFALHGGDNYMVQAAALSSSTPDATLPVDINNAANSNFDFAFPADTYNEVIVTAVVKKVGESHSAGLRKVGAVADFWAKVTGGIASGLHGGAQENLEFPGSGVGLTLTLSAPGAGILRANLANATGARVVGDIAVAVVSRPLPQDPP